jgi:hypothetical protein
LLIYGLETPKFQNDEEQLAKLNLQEEYSLKFIYKNQRERISFIK